MDSSTTDACALTRAAALLARYDWQLLSATALVARCAPNAHTTTDLLHAYVLALYDACSGCEGHTRQERGYTELHAFLHAAAQRRYRDVAADAAQRATESVYRTFARCRVPGAFLAFATQQLLNAARFERRLNAPTEHTLDSADEQWEAVGADPAASVEGRELRQLLRSYAARFAQEHPRAQLQLAALLLKYLDGLDDDAIAARLQRSVGSVHTLRSRAVARLRNDPAWRALAVDLGVCAAM